MRFGSNEIFGRICAMVTDPESAGQYEQLYEIVRDDTLAVIRRDTLSPEEREDIVQNVELAVFRGLVRFVDTYADCTEEERNRYLRRIIANKRNDCLAEQYRGKHYCSYDGDDAPVLAQEGSMEDAVMNEMQLRQELFQSIRAVCSLRTTPDKIIAFLLNKLTAVLDSGGRNGTPAVLSRRLSGYTQKRVAEMTVRELERLMGCQIPKEVVWPLFAKLKERTPEGLRGDLPFRLTPRDITDSSSWIASKMRKQKETIIGGNGNDSPSKF